MSSTLRDQPASPPAGAGRGRGGSPARRAIVRWAWRMFLLEWRQQLLVLALLAVAVAATTAGSAFATEFPASPAEATFGAASDLVTLPGSDPHLAADITAIRSRFGSLAVIENRPAIIPGSVAKLALRAQDPGSAYGQPLLSLLAGHYPTGAGEVALTDRTAALLNLRVGGIWHQGGRARRVVGLVQDPQNLLDDFALVAPGQLRAPAQVTILFDATSAAVAGYVFPDGAAAAERPRPASGFSFSVSLVLILDTLGLLFVGLVAVAGFTVVAQRRLRALGMISALGATGRHVRLVLLANGAAVGTVASLAGAAAGTLTWIAFAPALQSAAEHRIDRFALPWAAIAAAIALAIVTSVAAAWWPARAAGRISVVSALSGRPPSPRPARRLVLLGTVALAAGLGMLAFADDNGGVPPLVLAGIVATTVGLALIGPGVFTLLAAAGRSAPIALRLALRDLARYRARSGAALAAVSLAAGVAAIVILAVTQAAAQARQASQAGPNLPANQLIVYVSPGGVSEVAAGLTPAQLRNLGGRVTALATSLHATALLPLDAAVHRDAGTYISALANMPAGYEAAGLVKVVPTCPAPAVEYAGQVYIATAALLRLDGIKPAAIRPGTDVLTSRSDLAGVQLTSGAGRGCGYSSGIRYLRHPVIEVAGLPAGVSDPGTLITARAVRALGLKPVRAGWLIQTSRPLTSAQIRAARQLAVAAGVSVETRSASPTLSQLRYWITAAGLLLALGVLAMTTGLIRSETSGDLRTLTATGAGSGTRRLLTGATAGALGLLGAVLGTTVAYLAIIAWHRSTLQTLRDVPVTSLLILVIGLPLIATAAGWLLAGREPPAIGRQPLQ